MLHAISLGLAMAALWMALSGYFEPLLLGFGVFSVALTVYISHRMDVIDHEGHPIHHGTKVILYWPWLIKEIVIANWDVAKTILGFGDPVSTSVFKTPASQISELDQVIYANSITLTPGTVTISAESGNIFEVHALTRASRAGVEGGEMNRRCAAFGNLPSESEKDGDT
ncbi:MAG: Na+/H+ antiporter subunit E [Rhodospirillaceae bacterium]|nr:Na+/H+ antiporter subunit E [Rhodospirillaceae bacterium]